MTARLATLADLPTEDAYRAVLTFLGTLIVGGLILSLAGAVVLRPVGLALTAAGGVEVEAAE